MRRLPGLHGTQRHDGRFAVSGAAAKLVEHAAALRDDVAEAVITGVRGNTAALIASAVLDELEVLALVDIDDGDARALSGATLPRLRELEIGPAGALGSWARAGELSPMGIAALSAAPWFEGLERLALSGNRLDDVGAEAIAGARLPALAVLRLAGCRIGKDGAAALARASLPALRELDLGNPPRPTATPDSNLIGADGASAIAASAWISALAVLRLGGNNIGDAGAVALATARLTAREVDLRHNGITSEGAEALAAGGWARAARLGLTGNRLAHEHETVGIYDQGGELGTEPRPLNARELAARYGLGDVY